MNPESARHEVLSEADLLRISALMDGESDSAEVRQTTLLLASNPSAKVQWHRYALLGDVLRSDDLARPPAHDEAFLNALRGRMASEPVVFAPQPPSASSAVPPSVQPGGNLGPRRPQIWTQRLAIGAFGVSMLAIGAAVRLPGSSGAADPQLASTGGNGTVALASENAKSVMDRNPELDRYLVAHRQFAQGPAFAAPGGVRQVALTPEGQ